MARWRAVMLRVDRRVRRSSGRGGQVPCPLCGHGFSRVIVTQRTRRRRECQKCGGRFTTFEKVADHLYGRAQL